MPPPLPSVSISANPPTSDPAGAPTSLRTPLPRNAITEYIADYTPDSDREIERGDSRRNSRIRKNMKRQRRRIREAVFRRSYYSAHGTGDPALPAYSVPAATLHEQSAAIGNLGLGDMDGQASAFSPYTTAGIIALHHSLTLPHPPSASQTSASVQASTSFDIRRIRTADTTTHPNPGSFSPSVGRFSLFGGRRASVISEQVSFLSATEGLSMYGAVGDDFVDDGYAPAVNSPLLDKTSTPPSLAATLLSIAPAIALGSALNLLNAVSYGMILFPLARPEFADFGPDGIAMYLLSSIVCQIVLSLGGSAIPGAVGGMILEIAPFLHIIAGQVIADIGDSRPEAVIPTTMVAYASSAIVTGIAFLLLGHFKLGSLIGFFPRHILVGCIGGVGVFLLLTAFGVSSGLSFEHDPIATFFEPSALVLWGTALALALSLRIILRYCEHPLVLPAFLLAIPIFFFSLTSLLTLSNMQLRDAGWLFRLPEPSRPSWEFYSRFDFSNTSWSTLPKTFGAMLALTFFSILHVPINVPALSVSTGYDDVDISSELIGHGFSNIAAGLVGTVQNYLVYSSSVLFIRTGGGSRLAGSLLGATTFALFIAGTAPVAYIPVPVVGALIFHLGFELSIEALYHPYGHCSNLEYLTIVIIVFSMAFIGFLEGLAIGILLACIFFVVTYASRPPLRHASPRHKSHVRRLRRQRQLLDSLADQICIRQLQGFLFFGSVAAMEAKLREDGQAAHFIILDFSLVNGIDFSAAEAFVRLKRALRSSAVAIVVCGVDAESQVGRALRGVEVWGGGADEEVQNLQNLDCALEWCENRQLEIYYAQRVEAILGNGPFTPRLDSVRENAINFLGDDEGANADDEATTLLKQALSPTDDFVDTTNLFPRLSCFFERFDIEADTTFWEAGDPPRGLILIARGSMMLVSTAGHIAEHAMPGAMIGSSNLVTGFPYEASLVCAGEGAVIWQLGSKDYALMKKQEKDIYTQFLELILNYLIEGIRSEQSAISQPSH